MKFNCSPAGNDQWLCPASVYDADGNDIEDSLLRENPDFAGVVTGDTQTGMCGLMYRFPELPIAPDAKMPDMYRYFKPPLRIECQEEWARRKLAEILAQEETVMKVRVKFKVECKSPQDIDGACQTITLRAVYDGSPENKEFFKYTPAGQINLSIVNAVAAKQFEVGREYYVDFIPAPLSAEDNKTAVQKAAEKGFNS